jgi:hypothetical protein
VSNTVIERYWKAACYFEIFPAKQLSHLQAPTSTALLITLAASTGGSNSSFAEFSVVVSGNITADEISAHGTVTVYDQGEAIGTSKLSSVIGSSLPGATAGDNGRSTSLNMSCEL